VQKTEDNAKNGFLLDPDDSAGFEACLQKSLSEPEMLRSMRQAIRLKSMEFEISQLGINISGFLSGQFHKNDPLMLEYN
jgi:hypothetical protein